MRLIADGENPRPLQEAVWANGESSHVLFFWGVFTFRLTDPDL